VGLYTRARSVDGLTRDEVVKLSMLLLSPSVASRSKWKSKQRDQISHAVAIPSTALAESKPRQISVSDT